MQGTHEMKSKTAMLACCAMLAASALNTAVAGKPDPAIGKKLEAQGLKYEVDDDGDYKLLFAVEGDRSQIVWVRSPVETLGSLRIREILSIAGKSPKPETPEQIISSAVAATAALMSSNRQKLGGWVLKGSDDNQAFYYVAQVPADIDADDLEIVVRAVAKEADAFEVVIEAFNDSGKKDVY